MRKHKVQYRCCSCCKIDKQYGVHSTAAGTHQDPCDIHKTPEGKPSK